jgi:hypothetical protein
MVLGNLIFYKLNRVVCLMRLGGESTNINFFLTKTKEDLLILKKFFKNYFFIFIKKIIQKIPQLFKTTKIKKNGPEGPLLRYKILLVGKASHSIQYPY